MKYIETALNASSSTRINAIELVIRGILSALSDEQLNKVNELSIVALENVRTQLPKNPSQVKTVEDLEASVKFLFSHLPDRK